MSRYDRSHSQRTVTASLATVAISETNELGETTTGVGVKATCDACGHETKSFGTGSDSKRRCLALLREECPMGESNWYEEA